MGLPRPSSYRLTVTLRLRRSWMRWHRRRLIRRHRREMALLEVLLLQVQAQRERVLLAQRALALPEQELLAAADPVPQPVAPPPQAVLVPEREPGPSLEWVPEAATAPEPEMLPEPPETDQPEEQSPDPVGEISLLLGLPQPQTSSPGSAR